MHTVSDASPVEPQPATKTSADLAIEQIAASQLFRKSPSLRDLLLSLGRHRNSSLSEYAIGVEVLGRRSDFDPKTDATVRVQISRLRQRLKEYYESEGRDHPRKIQIPHGEYRVELVEVESPPAPPVPEAPKRESKGMRWTSPVLMILIALAVFLAWDDLRLRREAESPAFPPIHVFWQRLAKKGTPLPIVVPAPLFFRWGELPFVVRDFRVGTPAQAEGSDILRLLGTKYGKPETNQLYTVASDTVAASTLSRYLEDRGVPAAVVDTSVATVDLLATRSAIVFVGPGSTPEQAVLMEQMNFYLKPNGGGVFNRAPRAGEPERFSDILHSPLRSTSHGILARLPGRAPGTQVLLFASSFNPALVFLLTTAAELDSLRALHVRNGGSEFFEIVVRYERNADRVLRASPVAYRAVSPTR